MKHILKCNYDGTVPTLAFQLLYGILLSYSGHTGSFPSIASIHSRLLASDSACRVMTPCLQRKRDHSSLHNQAEVVSQFNNVARSLSVIFPTHLSTTSMSKQKRLSIESLFLLTHERSLNISGTPFTTPFCYQRHVQNMHSMCVIKLLTLQHGNSTFGCRPSNLSSLNFYFSLLR